MSVSRLFTIIGDANVRRNMTGLNMASREVMKTAQIVDCDSMASLDSALTEVRQESTVLIIASITEFLISGGFCGTIWSSIDPTLASFATKINNFCNYRPTLQVIVVFTLSPLKNLFSSSMSLTNRLCNLGYFCSKQLAFTS